jgi:hypothetical protein
VSKAMEAVLVTLNETNTPPLMSLKATPLIKGIERFTVKCVTEKENNYQQVYDIVRCTTKAKDPEYFIKLLYFMTPHLLSFMNKFVNNQASFDDKVISEFATQDPKTVITWIKTNVTGVHLNNHFRYTRSGISFPMEIQIEFDAPLQPVFDKVRQGEGHLFYELNRLPTPENLDQMNLIKVELRKIFLKIYENKDLSLNMKDRLLRVVSTLTRVISSSDFRTMVTTLGKTTLISYTHLEFEFPQVLDKINSDPRITSEEKRPNTDKSEEKIEDSQ